MVKIIWVVLGFLLLPAPLPAEGLSDTAKSNVIFNYAESCRWQRPAECSRSDPNFGDNPAVAPYRELCQESAPSACLKANHLDPNEGLGRTPLPLNVFLSVEILINNAKHAFGLKAGGIAVLQVEDQARPEPYWPWDHDRRLFRTYYAIDDGHAFVFWPWQLGEYAAFCGMNTGPEDCLASYGPKRPATSTPQFDVIFNYAERCRWLSPAECARVDPNISDNPAVAPYRELCQERQPSSCLQSNHWTDEVPDRGPLPLDSFQNLEIIVGNAMNAFGVKAGGVTALQAEDRSRPEPRLPTDHDRRLFRTYYAIDDGHAFVFWPWQLAEYAGFCGMDMAPEDCLVYYAPARPRPTLTLLVTTPLLVPNVVDTAPVLGPPPVEPSGSTPTGGSTPGTPGTPGPPMTPPVPYHPPEGATPTEARIEAPAGSGTSAAASGAAGQGQAEPKAAGGCSLRPAP